MKILIITQKLDASDPILGFFHRWIEEFSKHVESLTVICLYKGEYDLPKNVKVLSLGKEAGESRIKYIINFYKYIWRERKNYDNVFVHMNQIYVLLGGIFWKLVGKKISLWYTHKSVTVSLRIALIIVDNIFTASKESFRIKSDKLKVTGHGIDTGIFKPIQREGNNMVKIISVGRLSSVKGYEYIISAMDLMNNKTICEIWGSASLSSDKEYVDKLKIDIEKQIPQKVFLKGSIPQDKLNNVLNTADIFINISSTGSLDKAILEAMSAGVIVITSNEAFSDILSIYPYIYVSRDVKKIAESIEKVISLSLEQKMEISNYFRKYVQENHSLKTLIPKLVSYIK